jgi:tetratricopeptide (TPR) repeat protein
MKTFASRIGILDNKWHKMRILLFVVTVLLGGVICCKQTAEEYFKKGEAKYHQGDFNKAIVNFDKAIEINPQYLEAYYYRGSIKFFLKDYSGALIDFDKTIEIDPNDGEFYYQRALAKLLIGDKNGACLDWEKALKLNHSMAEIMIEAFCKKNYNETETQEILDLLIKNNLL